ncbi:hypothetical protein [Thalassoglobus sp.]|uniref:phage major capsid protein n=1 Tax=Thalassoglobus sp. TaxID=2795869 RepID=UPI003AA8E5BF
MPPPNEPETSSTNPRKPDTWFVPTSFRILEAQGPSDFQLLEAAADADDAKQLRKFKMTAYTGGKLLLAGYTYPVVVDLSGIRVTAKSRPILRDHDASRIVGHTETIEINAGSIRLSGAISGSNEHAREVTDSGDNGFPWQSSIGAIAQRMVFVDRGESVEVNGRKFSGPLYVARQSSLREVSFVALGADDQTIAKLIAARGHDLSETNSPSALLKALPMNFETWLQAKGFKPDELSEEQSSSLQALFDLETKEPDPKEPESNADETETVTSETVTATGETGMVSVIDATTNMIKDLRDKVVAERRRIAKISDICKGDFPEIEAKAVAEGWDTNKTELTILRESRPKAPAIHGAPPVASARVLEAAVWMSAHIAEPQCLREFGEQTLEAAHPLRQIGLRELVAECARLEGHDVPRVFGDGRAVINAGFSTIALPGILESVMNRTMMAAYEASPIAALQLCAVGSVSDFKEVSRYRLLGTGGFEKVSPTGELKHGSVDEQKFGNKADTYGQMLILDRRDIVNDDLDAFLDLPRQMGRSGAESIDDLFFTLFLSNPGNFFKAGNNNYLEGAETAFGPDSLTTAKTLFRKQKAGPGSKAKDQKPINVRPKYLVVPVEVETDAELLMGSSQLMIDASGTKTKIPVDNPHRNKYEVVSMPHLSDSFYPGNSAKAWYLFADPAVLPAFEIVFLNGRRTPVVERVEAPPNTLGMGFRAYLDVGCREQDPRGAVKSKGEA